MSAEPRPYSLFYIRAWTAFSIFFGCVLFILFVFGDHFLHLGYIIWSLIRWIFSPII
jgi:hypothetical protein